jgi:hypothetical protein
MKPGTYRAYERPPGSSKHIELDHQMAIRFARKFKVSWQWLLTGEGSPFDDRMPETLERVVRAMSVATDEQQEAVADFVERIVRTGTER